MNWTVRPVPRLSGEITVPGDKSITHRALLLSSLGEGAARIAGYLDGGDCRATIGCLRGLGIAVDQSADELVVHGRGLRGWREPDDVLDCVRSGTTMRLLAGLLAGQSFYSVLSAEGQLRRRPMGRVASPLAAMGARIYGRSGGSDVAGVWPPLTIVGGPLQGAEHHLPMASAQVKSCLLLAGLYAEGVTCVTEPGPSRDHTERMLRARGVAVETEGLTHRVSGPAEALASLDTTVPGDFSSAAFYLVAGLLAPAGEVRIRNVGVNATRTGLWEVLRAMGADLAQENVRDEGGEPVADLVARPGALRSVEVGGEVVPRMIDEFSILALAATQAEGVTVVRDAAELRVKETDRIATLVQELRALGARIEGRPDGFVIEGPTSLQGAVVEGHGDHRLAMTLAIAGLIAAGATEVRGVEAISDSCPGFDAGLDQLCNGGWR